MDVIINASYTDSTNLNIEDFKTLIKMKSYNCIASRFYLGE